MTTIGLCYTVGLLWNLVRHFSMKKNKKKTSKKKYVLSSLPAYSDSQFGTILHDIDDKLQKTVEGYNSLDSKSDRIEKNLEEHIQDSNFKFRTLGDSLNEFKHEMYGFRDDMYGFRDEMYGFRDETKKNFELVFQYLSRIDDEVQDIKKELREIKLQLDKKADLSKVLALEARLVKVEKDLERYKTKLT